jgi:hypothetical protein
LPGVSRHTWSSTVYRSGGKGVAQGLYFEGVQSVCGWRIVTGCRLVAGIWEDRTYAMRRTRNWCRGYVLLWWFRTGNGRRSACACTGHEPTGKSGGTPVWKAKTNGSAIDVSDADLNKVRARLDAEPDLCVLAYRFSGDKTVPADRFAMLRKRLGERFVGVTFDSSPGNPNGYPASSHSVLTTHLVPEARDEVVALFKRQLLSVSS